MSDLLYRGEPTGLPGMGSSISGASKDVISMVVPSIDNLVPLIELNGALSVSTPRYPSVGRVSSKESLEYGLALVEWLVEYPDGKECDLDP